jgi:hypothetical protein
MDDGLMNIGDDLTFAQAETGAAIGVGMRAKRAAMHAHTHELGEVTCAITLSIMRRKQNWDSIGETIYIMFILASPLTRLLNPSTTVRCEHIAGGANPPKEERPHYLDVVSSIQVKEWIGSCLYPFSCQDFGLSLQENLEGERPEPSLDLRVTLGHLPEFGQDLEKHRSCWRLWIRPQSRDSFACFTSFIGQRLKVGPQLTKCPQRLGKRLPRRGHCLHQRYDVALYYPEAC